MRGSDLAESKGGGQLVSGNVPIENLFSLAGRVALVTGGAGRYGSQISQALAEAGATVLIAARRIGPCEQFADRLKADGFSAAALQVDLSSGDSVDALADQVRSKWGHLDVLFNNAAAVSSGPLEQYSADQWAETMQCNSTGLYRICRVFGAGMAERGAGSIINVASIYAAVSPDFRIYEGHPEMTNPPSYGFAKAGMVQLTRYLAVHYASRGVRVNCISPGGLYSPKMPDQFVTNYCDRVPLRRMAGPNDLKGAAVLLASDASAYITGQNLMVDGGYSAV